MSKMDVDFDVFLKRCGVDLGSLLGVKLGSFWRLGGPKLDPEPSSNRPIFEENTFHYEFRFLIENCQNRPEEWAKIDPRSLQDGS